MTTSHIHFTSSALGAVLRSAEMRTMVNKAANDIAAKARAQHVQVGAFSGGQGPIDMPVRVESATTDRATAFVVLAHPAGIAAQAKLGTLTKAASDAGISVHGD